MIPPYAALDQRYLQFWKKTPSPTPTSIVLYTGQQVNRYTPILHVPFPSGWQRIPEWTLALVLWTSVHTPMWMTCTAMLAKIQRTPSAQKTALCMCRKGIMLLSGLGVITFQPTSQMSWIWICESHCYVYIAANYVLLWCPCSSWPHPAESGLPTPNTHALVMHRLKTEKELSVASSFFNNYVPESCFFSRSVFLSSIFVFYVLASSFFRYYVLASSFFS